MKADEKEKENKVERSVLLEAGDVVLGDGWGYRGTQEDFCVLVAQGAPVPTGQILERGRDDGKIRMSYPPSSRYFAPHATYIRNNRPLLLGKVPYDGERMIIPHVSGDVAGTWRIRAEGGWTFVPDDNISGHYHTIELSGHDGRYWSSYNSNKQIATVQDCIIAGRFIISSTVKSELALANLKLAVQKAVADLAATKGISKSRRFAEIRKNLEEAIS